jgi:hypothetical protein
MLRRTAACLSFGLCLSMLAGCNSSPTSSKPLSGGGGFEKTSPDGKNVKAPVDKHPLPPPQ